MIATIQIDSTPTLTQFQPPITHGNGLSTFPVDLREWLDTSQLISFVLEAVKTLCGTDCEEAEEGLESHQPQLILRVLTYCYATGLYSADEIAHRVATGTALSYLALNNQFTRRRLSLFRSQNRELLRRCLSRLLERAWETRFGKTFSCSTTDARLGKAFRNYFDNEAAERIGRALRTDYHAASSTPAVQRVACALSTAKWIEPPTRRRQHVAVTPVHCAARTVLPTQRFVGQRNLAALIAVLLLLLMALACVADDSLDTIQLGDKIHRNGRVVADTPADVTINFDGGGAPIKRQDLSSPLKEKYPYDPAEAARFQKQASDYRNTPESRQRAAEAVESAKLHQQVTVAGARGALHRKGEDTRASIRGLRNQLELVKDQIVVLDNSGRGRPRVRQRYLAAADQVRQQRLQLLKQIQQQEEQLRQPKTN